MITPASYADPLLFVKKLIVTQEKQVVNSTTYLYDGLSAPDKLVVDNFLAVFGNTDATVQYLDNFVGYRTLYTPVGDPTITVEYADLSELQLVRLNQLITTFNI